MTTAPRFPSSPQQTRDRGVGLCAADSPENVLIGRGTHCYTSGMTEYPADEIDRLILDALQKDGRIGYAELARKVNMSASAVTERVRRLEEAGVIEGYTAVVSPERLGLQILAFVRLRYALPRGQWRSASEYPSGDRYSKALRA